MHGLAVFVYRITASNNIPADLMKEEGKKKKTVMKKMLGLFQLRQTVTFSSKLLSSLPPVTLLGDRRDVI